MSLAELSVDSFGEGGIFGFLAGLEVSSLEPVELLRCRGVVFGALDECSRNLHLLSRRSPKEGLDALVEGERLVVLFGHLLRWSSALRGRLYEGTVEDRDFYEERLCVGGGAFGSECKDYPLRLRGFLARQRVLSGVPGSRRRTKELKVLSRPLLKAVRVMRREARERLSSQEERLFRAKRFWRRGLGLGVCCLLLCVFLYFRVWLPVPASFVGLPLGKKAGGIVGSYYKGRRFEQLKSSRMDRKLSMYWRGSPLRGLPKDYFSVRWRGYLHIPVTGSYRLCLRVDDGGRLRLGTRWLIDAWRGSAKRTRCGAMTLGAGWHSLLVEMFENRGPAQLVLYWRTPLYGKNRVISSRRLCCRR